MIVTFQKFKQTAMFAGFTFINLPSQATASDLDLLKKVCFDSLMNTAKASEHLEEIGWKKISVQEAMDHKIISPMIVGLRAEKSVGFVNEKQTEIFLFGQSDNDLYPNMQCIYGTEDKEFPAQDLKTEVMEIWQGYEPKISKVGKVITSRQTTNWTLGNYERNLSADAPYNGATLTEYYDPWFGSKDKTAAYIFTIVGMLPKPKT